MVTVMSVPNNGSGPSTQTTQGGVTVQSDNTIAGIDIANTFRRPVRAYVYETQMEAEGVVTNVSPATLFAGPFDLGEPAALTFGLPTSIGKFLALPLPSQAYTLSPIPLVLDGDSDETTYEVVVIGPSASGVVPPFFGAARYANEVAGWNAAIGDLFAESYYTDIVYAVLLEITGFGSIFPASPNLVAAGVNTRKFAGIPFTNSNDAPPLPPTAQLLGSAISSTLDSVNTNLALNSDYLAVAPTIMDKVEAAALKQVNSIDWQASVKAGSNFLMKLGSPFANYQANGALGKLLANLATADAGLLWTVAADKAQVTITPANPAVYAGGIVALTVVLSSDLTSTYEFDWGSNSSTATFSAIGESNVGAGISTQEMAVNLITTPADTNPIFVLLTVYDLGGGHKAFLTRVSATVAVVRKAVLSPVSVVLSVGDQKTFAVSVPGGLPANVHYLWSDVGGSGSIGGVNVVTTTVPQITYTAEQKGTDTLSVQVADASNTLLATGSALIYVDPDPVVRFTIAGNWPTFGGEPANGAYIFGSFHGMRYASVLAGLDLVLLNYDLGVSAAGVSVGLWVPPGEAISSGETFSERVTGSLPAAHQFQLILSSDLNNVDNSGANIATGTGTLAIDALNQLQDGTFVAQYSINITNSAGGTIVGSGVGNWT